MQNDLKNAQINTFEETAPENSQGDGVSRPAELPFAKGSFVYEEGSMKAVSRASNSMHVWEPFLFIITIIGNVLTVLDIVLFIVAPKQSKAFLIFMSSLFVLWAVYEFVIIYKYVIKPHRSLSDLKKNFFPYHTMKIDYEFFGTYLEATKSTDGAVFAESEIYAYSLVSNVAETKDFLILYGTNSSFIDKRTVSDEGLVKLTCMLKSLLGKKNYKIFKF